jgi:hypothetical protein
MKQNPITLEFEDEELQMELLGDKANVSLRKLCAEMEKINATEMVKK